ncbi:hypothetical protein QE401_001047 [Pseudoroseomonas cervicalis]|nr:hypothetical protein [Pseudoroseomonas cervicalis]
MSPAERTRPLARRPALRAALAAPGPDSGAGSIAAITP